MYLLAECLAVGRPHSENRTATLFSIISLIFFLWQLRGRWNLWIPPENESNSDAWHNETLLTSHITPGAWQKPYDACKKWRWWQFAGLTCAHITFPEFRGAQDEQKARFHFHRRTAETIIPSEVDEISLNWPFVIRTVDRFIIALRRCHITRVSARFASWRLFKDAKKNLASILVWRLAMGFQCVGGIRVMRVVLYCITLFETVFTQRTIRGSMHRVKKEKRERTTSDSDSLRF